jgi:peptide/nickel transport system substrate-binding protein
METQPIHPQKTWGIRRRNLLKAGLAASATLSAWPLQSPSLLWGAEAGPPKRGGILRVWGFDPPHFDPHLTTNVKTNATLSFVYSTLVRHKVGPGISPGSFIVEPHLAERWEAPDDTTYIFHLRKGVQWHNKPPVNGRELVAEDVQFTFDRFLTEKGNADRYALESVDRVEVVDRYTVKFLLKEPYVWLIDVLANPRSMWIVAPEVVQHFGDLKQPESAIGTGPFLLERYEPNVKTVFTRHPDYFLPGLPWVDGVEWMVVNDPSAALAMYRSGQLDCGPAAWWGVRQEDLDALKKTHPHLRYQDFLSTVSHAISMRTDQAPFTDVRVRRAISLAVNRQEIIDAVFLKGEPTPAVSRGLSEWSPRIDELGAGARYYQYDPTEARRLLAEAGVPKGFKTLLHTTGGSPAGPLMTDAAQLAQRALKEIGIEAELKIEEYGAYMATTYVGKFEGLALSGISIAWEPDSVLYGLYAPDQPRNSGHVNDPKITAMLKEQRRTKDREARKKIIFDIQRHIAEQQYYVYLYAVGITGSWQPYEKNYAPNTTFDFGGRAAALWLNREK